MNVRVDHTARKADMARRIADCGEQGIRRVDLFEDMDLGHGTGEGVLHDLRLDLGSQRQGAVIVRYGMDEDDNTHAYLKFSNPFQAGGDGSEYEFWIWVGGRCQTDISRNDVSVATWTGIAQSARGKARTFCEDRLTMLRAERLHLDVDMAAISTRLNDLDKAKH
jgi:hypothetical protein